MISGKTVEDVGEFAFRFYIISPTVFQIRSEKEKTPDAPEKLQENSCLTCKVTRFYFKTVKAKRVKVIESCEIVTSRDEAVSSRLQVKIISQHHKQLKNS